MIDNWPIYFKDRLIISNTNSSNVIITLWTPKEVIQKLSNQESYYLMGQLYTKKGINYIVRNLLSNPVITDLYIFGNDLMQSGDALINFFNNGVDSDYIIIGDNGKIDKEISLHAIGLLRHNIKIHDYRGANNIVKVKDVVIEKSILKSWSDPMIFDDPPKPQISTFPSEIDLIKIKRPTISEAYLSVLKHIEMFGLESQPPINNSSSDSNKMKELLNLSVVITDEDPCDPLIPEYMTFNKDDLDSYYKGFFDHDRHTEDYTYGERLYSYAKDEIFELKKIYPWLKIDRFKKYFDFGGINQVEVAIVRKLKKFQYDKGAIALLGNVFTDVFPQRPPKKIPCLFLIQCQIYQGKLFLTAYFRSNDMYSAWPLNAFALRKLQYNIAEKLDVSAGALITISNMAHVYEHNFSDMEKILKDNYKGYYCEWDPRGNLVISTDDGQIHVKQMSPDGNDELRSWSIDGKKHLAAQELCFILERDLSISVLGNALYIGREIERAEISIKLGLEYHQDTPLAISK